MVFAGTTMLLIVQKFHSVTPASKSLKSYIFPLAEELIATSACHPATDISSRYDRAINVATLATGITPDWAIKLACRIWYHKIRMSPGFHLLHGIFTSGASSGGSMFHQREYAITSRAGNLGMLNSASS